MFKKNIVYPCIKDGNSYLEKVKFSPELVSEVEKV